MSINQNIREVIENIMDKSQWEVMTRDQQEKVFRRALKKSHWQKSIFLDYSHGSWKWEGLRPATKTAISEILKKFPPIFLERINK